jgi:hypothetical protein
MVFHTVLLLIREITWNTYTIKNNKKNPQNVQQWDKLIEFTVLTIVLHYSERLA